VRANLLAALRGRPGAVYNIGTGVATSIAELARTMCEVAGREADVLMQPARAGEVRRSVADIGRARRELGYEPRIGLRQGLDEIWRSLS